MIKFINKSDVKNVIGGWAICVNNSTGEHFNGKPNKQKGAACPAGSHHYLGDQYNGGGPQKK